MPKFYCDGVRQTNILSIFNAVVDGGCRTRAEIASYTRLSKVTVGKVVDAFLDVGLLVEIKRSNKPGRGQKTGFVYPDSKKRIAVIDISTRCFSLSFFTLDLKQKYYSKYSFIDDATNLENLYIFAGRLRAIFDAMSQYKFITTGLILRGKYDRVSDKLSSGLPWTENIRIREFFRQQSGINIDLLTDPTAAAANWCMRNSYKNSNTLYVNATDALSARLIVGDKNLRNNSNIVRRRFTSEPTAEETAGFIADLYALTGSCDIYIETDIPEIGAMQIRTFTKRITDKIVEITVPPHIVVNKGGAYSGIGAAFVMRRRLLDSIIK